MAGMSDTTRQMVHPDLLSQRVGRGTVASAMNRSIAFRLEGSGHIAKRRIVPDTKLAAELLASPAGPRVERFLRGWLSQAGEFGATETALAGVRLLPDEEAIGAANAFDRQFTAPAKTVVALAPGARETAHWLANRSGGWYSPSEWINLAPHTSRALLTFFGAYTPARSEERLRGASGEARYIPMLTTHELHHAITPAGDGGWLEEAQAMVLADRPAIRTKIARDMEFSPQRYAGQLGAPDTFDAGWKPWKNKLDEQQSAAEGARQTKVYRDSQEALVELLHMADVDLRTKQGWATSRELLQGGSRDGMSRRLATGIVENHGIEGSLIDDIAGEIDRSDGSLAKVRAMGRRLLPG